MHLFAGIGGLFLKAQHMVDPLHNTRTRITLRLREQGWQEPALSREVKAILKGDRFKECPLEDAEFHLERFSELGTVVIGSDGKCICTVESRCLNVDKRDGMRCTLGQLSRLNSEAESRRAWQSGEY